MPDLYIITGANGAGKSTVGFSYLPTVIQKNHTVFDGDKLTLQKKREFILGGLRSFKEAERRALGWLFEHFKQSAQKALKEKDDFVYEGHLPEDANWITPKRFKRAGYTIHFIFFGLKDTDLSEVRVMDRAKLGGHNVPPYEIQRNFLGNLYQINKRFKTIDELQIVDTSETANPKVLVLFKKGEVESAIHHGKLPEWFEQHLPNLYRKIMNHDSKNEKFGLSKKKSKKWNFS
ncbi:MAG: zeta toxin family protein [Ferruginibacter sp.]